MTLTNNGAQHQPMSVSVAYVGTNGEQFYCVLELSTPTTMMDAIKQSPVLQQFSDELDEQHLVTGIFSHKVAHPERHILQDGDRIEIYRPLLIDPKDIRRKRATAHPVGRMERLKLAGEKPKKTL